MPLFNQCSSEIISEIKMYGGSTPPDGWLLCNGAAISRTTYPYLFTVIGTTYGVGNGTTTFNLPDLRSRIPIGAGQTTFVSTFSYTSVNISTDIITVTSNDSLNTGSVVVLTTSGTAPTGLTASSTYYVIRVSATTIKLASSLANAIAGTSIDITGQGTGNHTLTITYSNRTLGSVGGEESHATTINEQPLHQHTIW